VRRYECIYILNPDLSTDEIEVLSKKFRDIILNGGGQLIFEDRWGIKNLAFEVKNHSKGYYVLLDYVAEKPVAFELERNFKILENVIRFLTVLKEREMTPEKVEELIKVQPEKPNAPKETSPEGSPEVHESRHDDERDKADMISSVPQNERDQEGTPA
jgi:small subunit ribosomal protein S6